MLSKTEFTHQLGDKLSPSWKSHSKETEPNIVDHFENLWTKKRNPMASESNDNFERIKRCFSERYILE